MVDLALLALALLVLALLVLALLALGFGCCFAGSCFGCSCFAGSLLWFFLLWWLLLCLFLLCWLLLCLFLPYWLLLCLFLPCWLLLCLACYALLAILLDSSLACLSASFCVRRWCINPSTCAQKNIPDVWDRSTRPHQALVQVAASVAMLRTSHPVVPVVVPWHDAMFSYQREKVLSRLERQAAAPGRPTSPVRCLLPCEACGGAMPPQKNRGFFFFESEPNFRTDWS